MKKEKDLDKQIPLIEEKNTDLTPDKFFSDIEKENNNFPIERDDIGDIEDIIETGKGEETADTYFKNVIEKLFSDDNISLKTEYENEDAVFTGAKLDFLTQSCGFKFGEKFLPLREKKMVSHKRQSRQEIVMGLWQREQQIRATEEQEIFKKQVNM